MLSTTALAVHDMPKLIAPRDEYLYVRKPRNAS